MLAVFAWMRVRYRGAILEHGAGFDDEEQRADAHGTKVAAEERFAICSDVRDEAFHGQNDGDAAEEEDEDQQTDQPAWRD